MQMPGVHALLLSHPASTSSMHAASQPHTHLLGVVDAVIAQEISHILHRHAAGTGGWKLSLGAGKQLSAGSRRRCAYIQ